MSGARVQVHGRRYRRPERPLAVICLDGSDPSYLEDVLAAGLVPHLARLRAEGTWRTVQAAMPTFTNPNNVSLVTGAPPAAHGISGNHFHDPARGVDVPMNQREMLRGETVLEALEASGVRVGVVSAKAKLVSLLGARHALAFSAERPGGFAGYLPDGPVEIYSPQASLAVLDAGLALFREGRAELLYLSTTDYVQHKHAPGSAEARAFYQELDRRLAALSAAGVELAITADHGMNAKTTAGGRPNVAYLGTLLGAGARVTLPITDPYVVHHGALGGCAFVDLLGLPLAEARARLAAEPRVEQVLAREEAARALLLPADRLADLVVLATRDAVLGKSPAEHDLSAVQSGLRSHGSAHEQAVPLILSRPLAQGPAPLHNWDVLAAALGEGT